MKVITVSINNEDTKVRQQLAIIFNYQCKQQLIAAGLKPNIIATGRILQGEVVVYAESTYDQMRTELFINNALKTINLFSTNNSNFVNYTDREKEKLNLMLKGTTKEVKNFYNAIKVLMGMGVYPPYSMQDELMRQASTFKLENEQEEQELNSLITENFKGSNLQTGSWVWNSVTETRNDHPLRKSLTLLAVALKENGIANAEELNLLTSNYSRKVYMIGSEKLKRIAMQEEVKNAANIKNLSISYVAFYSQIETYLTSVLHSLYRPAAYYINYIHHYCTAADSQVPYELRFNNVAPLQTMTASTVAPAVLQKQYAQFVFDNLETFEIIIAQLLIEVPKLVKKWKNSNTETVYPDGYDALQAYYEYENLDIDALDALLAIEADVSNIVEQLKQVKAAGMKSDYDKISYDIACKGLTNIKRYGNHRLTEKQLVVIEKRVQSLNKTLEMSKSINAVECIEVANTIKNNFKKYMNNVISNIVESTIRYGICSQKQLETMKLALVDYQQKVAQEQQKKQAKQEPPKQQGILFNVPGMPAPVSVPYAEAPASTTATQRSQGEVDNENNKQFISTDEAKKITKERTESAYSSAFGMVDDEEDDETDTNFPWT